MNVLRRILEVGNYQVEVVGSKGTNSMASKKHQQKGPLDMFFTPNLADIVKARKNQGRQKPINELYRKELREKAFTDITRWFYDAGIAFHGVTPDSFAIMCESIGQYGPGLKPPSMYELRVPLLKKEVEDTKKEMTEHKKEWGRQGLFNFIRWLA